MRNLGPHWTIEGAAKELNRLADNWEFQVDREGSSRNRDRLHAETILHENTRMAISFARYRLMLKGEGIYTIRRFKMLGMRSIDPKNQGATLPPDWDNLLAFAAAVFGDHLVRAMTREGKDKDGLVCQQFVVYYDDEWFNPLIHVNQLLADQATLVIDHPEFKKRKGGE